MKIDSSTRSTRHEVRITPQVMEETQPMRKQEVRVKQLLQLVLQDYIDNEQKSLATVQVNINHLKPHFDERSAERVSPAAIEEYKVVRRSEGAANSTVNLELAALRRAFSLGIERELIRSRPKIQLYRVGKRNARKGFFEHEDFTKMLAVLKPYQAHMLRFAYVCGWREGELFSLRWKENYDAHAQMIRIFDSKSGDGRTLPLLDDDGKRTELGEVIAERLSERGSSPFVFHYKGKPLYRTLFNKHWRKACAAAEVQRHFHDLRRTASRNMRRAGASTTERMMIIGHRTEEMDRRYDIINERDVQITLTKVQAFLKRQTRETAQLASRVNSTPAAPAQLAEIAAELAEREGFEPSVPLPAHTISSQASIGTLAKLLWKAIVRK